MNVATTVLKQTTTTSVRMSNSVHCSDLSTLNIHNKFDDNFNNKKEFSAQQHHKLVLLQPKQSSSKAQYNSINNQKITNGILMESNSITNVTARKKTDMVQRRHTFCLRDEDLLKVLSAPPDEPLYINDNNINSAAVTTTATTICQLNGDSDDNNYGVQTQLTRNSMQCNKEIIATSSIVNSISVDDNENLPPSDKCIVTSNEG